jgi:hypothetical protein
MARVDVHTGSECENSFTRLDQTTSADIHRMVIKSRNVAGHGFPQPHGSTISANGLEYDYP